MFYSVISIEFIYFVFGDDYKMCNEMSKETKWSDYPTRLVIKFYPRPISPEVFVAL